MGRKSGAAPPALPPLATTESDIPERKRCQLCKVRKAKKKIVRDNTQVKVCLQCLEKELNSESSSNEEDKEEEEKEEEEKAVNENDDGGSAVPSPPSDAAALAIENADENVPIADTA